MTTVRIPDQECWTAANIARERGISRQAAWVWLRQVEVEFGSDVVFRKDGRLYVTIRDLRMVEISRRPKGAQQRTDKRLAALEAARAELETQVTAQARDLTSLRGRLALAEAIVDKLEAKILRQT
jgi:hypothetical protein